MNTPKDKQSQDKENECSDTWTCSVELEASALQQSNLVEYRQRGMRGGLRGKGLVQFKSLLSDR